MHQVMDLLSVAQRMHLTNSFALRICPGLKYADWHILFLNSGCRFTPINLFRYASIKSCQAYKSQPWSGMRASKHNIVVASLILALPTHIDLYTTMEKLSPLLLSLLWMSWPVTSWAAQVTTDCPLHNYCDQGFTPGDNCKCYRAVDWNTQVWIKPSWCTKCTVERMDVTIV